MFEGVREKSVFIYDPDAPFIFLSNFALKILPIFCQIAIFCHAKRPSFDFCFIKYINS